MSATATPTALAEAAAQDAAAEAPDAPLGVKVTNDKPAARKPRKTAARKPAPSGMIEHVWNGKTFKVSDALTPKQRDEACRLLATKPNANEGESAMSARAKPKAKKAAKTEWTLFGAFEEVRVKKFDAKSKRGRILADLATAQKDDLVKIALAFQNAKTAKDLAAAANALNSALSNHYSRVK